MLRLSAVSCFLDSGLGSAPGGGVGSSKCRSGGAEVTILGRSSREHSGCEDCAYSMNWKRSEVGSYPARGEPGEIVWGALHLPSSEGQLWMVKSHVCSARPWLNLHLQATRTEMCLHTFVFLSLALHLGSMESL